jgi:hypothetical protein
MDEAVICPNLGSMGKNGQIIVNDGLSQCRPFGEQQTKLFGYSSESIQCCVLVLSVNLCSDILRLDFI